MSINCIIEGDKISFPNIKRKRKNKFIKFINAVYSDTALKYPNFEPFNFPDEVPAVVYLNDNYVNALLYVHNKWHRIVYKYEDYMAKFKEFYEDLCEAKIKENEA